MYIYIYISIYLVGGIPTNLEKYEFANFDDEIPKI